ncbi:MAG: cytochrome c3 family protein [Nitrospinaceae bacterium]
MISNNRGTKKYKIIIGLLAGLLVVVMGTGSLHLYDYTENDPEFCLNCHLMREAHHSWETSVHKSVNCHTCHYATLYEKNMMFVKTIFERPTEISERPHDQIIVPSTMCVTCHLAGDDKIIKVSRSKGHSLHWFKENIECTSCHAVELHQFAPEQKFCMNCHAQAKNMLPKMKDMACTSCHNFRTGRLVPGNEKCLQCHAEKSPLAQPASASRAHQPFKCNNCHQVHHPKKTAKTSCTECHQGAMRRGKHPVHLKALGNECLTCHTPHQWRISKKSASKLCSQCHKKYSLSTFLRI